MSVEGLQCWSKVSKINLRSERSAKSVTGQKMKSKVSPRSVKLVQDKQGQFKVRKISPKSERSVQGELVGEVE